MTHPTLRREMGLGGAIVTGLGSILGTGAFVAIGVAAGMWGDAVLVAIPIAGAVAMLNGLSSAFLATRMPVAGGTYEYGYQALGPRWGFTAGWLFLLAKTASAAAAALGIGVYLEVPWDRRITAAGAVIVITVLVLTGLRRTVAINIVLVALTVVGLTTFALAGLAEPAALAPLDQTAITEGLLAATAFLFVSYTGYGRIATLAEEVHRPDVTITRAVVVTLAIAAFLYAAVAVGGRGLGGERWGTGFDNGLTPVDLVVQPYSMVVAIAGVTAMLGVLLNLILGLSRVWLAMGRRNDMPSSLAGLDADSTPVMAVVVAAVPITLIVMLGDISIAWTFSAFTVLLYYGITNLSAIAIDRRRWTAWGGLLSCVLLSFFVPVLIWLAGAALIALGLLWKAQRPV